MNNHLSDDITYDMKSQPTTSREPKNEFTSLVPKQYRCANCSYATKYCHSLKAHLRRLKHEPAMVLNPEGTPNPLPIVDVYGKRRGSKVKAQRSKSDKNDAGSPKPPLQNVPFSLSQFMLSLPPQLQLSLAGDPYLAGFREAVSNALLVHLNILAMAQQQMAQNNGEGSSPTSSKDMEPLDLSMPDKSWEYKNREGWAPNSDSSDEEQETTMFSIVEVVEDNDTDSTEETLDSHNNKDNYYCHYCQINFREPILHRMHMGYHGLQNPFTCNICGETYEDRVSFFLHIARIPHA